MHLHGVETREVSRAGGTERLLYAFSRAFLMRPAGMLPLDVEEERVYSMIYQQVEQFRERRGEMAVRDFEALMQKGQELWEAKFRAYVQSLPPEELAQMLTPEKIAEMLASE